MEILSLIWSENNYIFTAAICIMLAIGILEGLLTIIGLGFSSALDNFFPDVDIDFDVPTTEIHSFTELFGWINKGKVPVLMLFIVFLTFFGLFGLGLQFITNMKFSQFLMAIPAIILTIPMLRWSSTFLGAIMPKDESSAISEKTFIGMIATISTGTAKLGTPAEAKFKDGFNETHYLMVEPKSDEEYPTGTKVIILSQKSEHIFTVTKDMNAVITE